MEILEGFHEGAREQLSNAVVKFMAMQAKTVDLDKDRRVRGRRPAALDTARKGGEDRLTYPFP